MSVEVEKKDGVCTLYPEGWVDSASAADLEQAVSENVGECEKMIIDLAGVDYLSSAGLRVVVSAHREMEKKQGLYLRNLSKNVNDIIRLTGFDKKLHIEKAE